MAHSIITAFSILALTSSGTLALAAPPASQTVSPDAVLGTPSLRPLTPAQADAARGPCRNDLSVDSIELSRRTPTGPMNIRVRYKNIGTEAFDAPPRFTAIVIETTHGGTARSERTSQDISRVLPGATQVFTILKPRTIFDTLEFSGEVRAFVNFGPDAPRCGMDPNPANDSLAMTNEQVRAWFYGTAPSVIVRR